MSIHKIRSVHTFGAALVAALSLLISVSAGARGLSLIRDAETEHIIRLYATPLLKAAAIPINSVQIILVRDNRLNAFVAGGNNIFIHTGLIDAADNASQVIGVLAHETGHIAAGHLIALRDNVDRAQWTTMIASALAIIGGVASGRPDLIGPGIQGGNQVAVRGFLANTRVNESEADQWALQLLDDTRQSASGLLEFFDKLGDQEALSIDSRFVDPYVRTHPLNRERIQTVRDHVAQSRWSNQRPDPALTELHDRMRAKLRAYLNPPSRTLRQYPVSDNSIVAQYARAILHMRQGDWRQGIPAIDRLIAKEPRNPFFHEMRGQLLLESGKVRESLPSLQRSVELAPHEPLLRMLFAKALIADDAEQSDRHALQNLNVALSKERNMAEAWRLAAMAYSRLGEEGYLAYADAEYNLLRGEYRRAGASAQRALKLLEKNSGPWIEANYILRKIEEAEH